MIHGFYYLPKPHHTNILIVCDHKSHFRYIKFSNFQAKQKKTTTTDRCDEKSVLIHWMCDCKTRKKIIYLPAHKDHLLLLPVMTNKNEWNETKNIRLRFFFYFTFCVKICFKRSSLVFSANWVVILSGISIEYWRSSSICYLKYVRDS